MALDGSTVPVCAGCCSAPLVGVCAQTILGTTGEVAVARQGTA